MIRGGSWHLRSKVEMGCPILVIAGLFILLSGCGLKGGGSSSLAESPGTQFEDDLGAWVRAGSDMLDACQEAADVLGFAVPCPMLLPGDLEPESLPQGRGLVWGDGFHLVPPLPGHLQEMADRQEVFHVVVTGGSRFDECDEGQLGVVTIDEWAVQLVECGGLAGLHADHVLAQWEHDGVWFIVSSHVAEDRNFHIAVVTRIVEHVEVVEPMA